MSQNKMIQEVVSNHDENDAQFAQWANKKIADFFAAMKPSTSKIDPDRLGTQSVLWSRAKQGCLEKVGPLEVDGRETGMKAFNQMSIKEQLKFQASARLSGDYKWVQQLKILPQNLQQFKMPDTKVQLLQTTRNKIDTAKLREDSEEVDGDRMLAKLMPYLSEGKRNAMAAALLLATGRRTTEVLLSGKLYLDESMNMDGYACMFSGQLKQGLGNDKPYEIPLLAPYWLVKKAWDQVRELFPIKGMQTDDVNQAYSSTINNFCKKAVGMNPHGLRACYALMTYQNATKMSLIGFISKVLGHSQPSAAAYYQRLKIVNYSGPWKPEEKFEAQEEEQQWVLEGAVEKKRLPGLIEMMEQKVPISATSIRSHAGGTMIVAARILERNADMVAEYNASLK